MLVIVKEGSYVYTVILTVYGEEFLQQYGAIRDIILVPVIVTVICLE